MASTATTYISAINTAFPVAGVDNDTQGFRDNYANIKNGMTSLSNEVSAIQADGVFVTQTNDFNNTGVIQNAQVQSTGYVIAQKRIGEIGGNQVLDYSEGNYQVWKITSATNFSFANFPDNASVHSPLQLELYRDPNTTTSITVTFVAATAEDILLDYNPNNQSSNPVTLTTSSSVIYELARTMSSTGTFSAYRLRFLGGPYKP